MIDVDGLANPPTAADFTFKVGNDNSPSAWTPAPAPQAITPLLELNGGRFVAGLLIAVLWVPMAEEWIFRGWLFRGLQRTRPGLMVALPATTLIFSLLHSFYSPGGVLVIGLLGLFLGWLRWRYDQLWLCVLAHATYNWVTLLRVAAQ